jgi:hypothetical protein
MSEDWKPVVMTQKVIVQMVMNGWNREKIIQWFEKDPMINSNAEYKNNMMQWLDKNLKRSETWK